MYQGSTRRPWTVLPVVALLGLASFVEAAPELTGQDVIAREVEAHTRFLADDLLEGRGTGTRGYALASRYVATQFARIGLVGAGDDGGYEQSLQLSETLDNLESGRFVLRTSQGEQVLETIGETLVRTPAGETTGQVTAPAVFVGYGVQAPELNYDDYRGIDVAGKIVVVLVGTPGNFPTNQRAHYSSASEKAALAVRLGAIGMVTIVTPDYERRYPWAFFVAQGRFARMRLRGADGSVVEGFPELRATATVSRAAAGKLFAAAAREVGDVFEKAVRGEAEPIDLKATIALAATAEVKTVESNNVVGLLPGTDLSLADEPLVLTGHLDHIGIGPAVNGDTIYNGAMDNAIGIGLLLAVAEQLANGEAPRRSILFAAVTAEEKGLLGAEHLARNPPAGVSKFAANLNLDMALFPAPVRDLIAWGAEHSSLGPVVAEAATAAGFTLSPDPLPDEVIFVRSDQYAFVRTGVPAIFVSAGQRSLDPTIDLAAQWNGFLRERYHKPNDDLQQPIDWPSVGAFGVVCTDIARRIAQAEAAPRWNEGDFFGDRFGPHTR